MLAKILLLSGLTVLGGVAHAQAPQAQGLPAALLVHGELVDVKNGFAIRVDQPNLAWRIRQDDERQVQYVGIDAAAHAGYLVGVDKKHYTEMTPDQATEFSNGVRLGLQQSGWTVKAPAIEPTTILRKNSFRAVYVASNADGAKVTFESYFTSPDKLYSIQCFAAEIDEQACQKLVSSFRLLAPESDAAGATANGGKSSAVPSSGAITLVGFFADLIVFFAFLLIAVGSNKLMKREALRPRLVGSIAVLVFAALQMAYIKVNFIHDEAVAALGAFDQGYVAGQLYAIALTPAILVLGIVGAISWAQRRK